MKYFVRRNMSYFLRIFFSCIQCMGETKRGDLIASRARSR
jgi:hypothetical protein